MLRRKLDAKDDILGIKNFPVSKKMEKNSECIEEAESTTSKQTYISNYSQTILNSSDEKSTVNFFEHTAHCKISKDVSEHDKNLICNSVIKQSKINAKSLEKTAPKLTENKHSVLSIHEVLVPINNAVTQPKSVLASSLKSNEQLNVQSLECNKITEECIKEFEEKHDMFSQNQLQVKNLPSKMPFVHLIRMKDTEIASYVSGKVNFAKPSQIKSLEESTKDVVVKVQKVTPNAILKRLGREKDSWKTTGRRVKSVRNRILAQEMKIVAQRKKAKVETIPKEKTNFQGQLENDISGKRNTTKSRRANEAKAGNFVSQKCFPTTLTLHVTNSSQIAEDESNARVLDPPNECFPESTTNNLNPGHGHDVGENTGDKIQLHSDLTQSSNTHENRTRNCREDTTHCETYCVHCYDMRIFQRIDFNSNAFIAMILDSFMSSEIDDLKISEW
ncbi:uncharacterized protein LOC129959012 [Argiope bruennichi]|uniref:uncharacterized protein LOC129959012 n=1 Tax=Argiope bruennichi TaxID=94029 RepID=UPI0024949233|nr:uncharacterized protein LOC129959012 [Argiope bruennichi]XP_055927752.1 uncharacterized protein LOC129959012 [Argiope bruennichi]